MFTKLNCNIILGLDFLEDKHAKIDLGLQTLSLYDGLTVCPLSQPQHDICFLARTISRVDIPPQCECNILVKVSSKPS